MIDDDELARRLRRLEPQSKLLLERGEDGLSAGTAAGSIGQLIRANTAARRVLVDHELEDEVEKAVVGMPVGR